jgi:hypothetical protein
MHIQNLGVNVSSMGFLKEAGEFFTGIADKIKLVWEECLPALKQIASTMTAFFTTHKKEAIYIGVGLLATAAVIGICIGAKKVYDYCTSEV